MTQYKALRRLVGAYGIVEEGALFPLGQPGPQTARKLLGQGLIAKVRTPPRVRKEGAAEVADPLAGSQTGGAKVSSSSAADPAPATATSASQGAKPGS